MKKLVLKIEEEINEAFEIENMIYCGAAVRINDDNDEKHLRLYYAAHIKNRNDIFCFCQDWLLDNKVDESVAEALSDCDKTLAVFFLERTNKLFHADFAFRNNDNSFYEFYAYDNTELNYSKFIMHRTISIGINMMHYSLATQHIKASLIEDMNFWLYNELEKIRHTEFNTIIKYEILDRSRTMKRGNINIGIAVVKLYVTNTLSIDKEYTTVFSYVSSKPVRNRSKTKNINLLEQMYGNDSYSILSSMGIGKLDDKDFEYLIGVNAENDYIIFSSSDLDMIKNLFNDMKNI